MLRLAKRKGSSLLRGLDAESILNTDDAAEVTQPTQRVTRQALHGEVIEPLYNMRYHPMDEVTRPGRTKRLRGTSTASDLTMKYCSDSDSGPGEDMSDAMSSSGEEHEEEAICLRRRREETTPTRKSTRAATKKLVNYDTSKHPQDRQLIKSGVYQASRRAKPVVVRKGGAPRRGNKQPVSKEAKATPVRFSKTYVAEDMDVFEQAPGTRYWPNGGDYKLHESVESPIKDLDQISTQDNIEVLRETGEVVKDNGVNHPGVGFSQDLSEDDSELMEDIDDLSQATSASNAEEQTLSSPCLPQLRKSSSDIAEAAWSNERTTNNDKDIRASSGLPRHVANDTTDHAATDSLLTAFRISLRHRDHGAAVDSSFHASSCSCPMSAKTSERDPVRRPPAVEAGHQSESNDTDPTSVPGSPIRVSSPLPHNTKTYQTTQRSHRASPDYQAPPGRQPDGEETPKDVRLNLSSNTSPTARDLRHFKDLCEPSPHHLAGEALRNGISFHEVVNPISGDPASSQLTGSFLISSQVSVGQPKDLYKRRSRKRGQTFSVHEDAQEHEITLAQHLMNSLQNSSCIDYPKENQQADVEATGGSLHLQGHTQQRGGGPATQEHLESEISGDEPQNDVDSQIHAEMASFSVSQRP